jgi:hypothetical protein
VSKLGFLDRLRSLALAPVHINACLTSAGGMEMYPVRTELDGIWITIGIISKGRVCHSTADLAIVFDDEEVRYGLVC